MLVAIEDITLAKGVSDPLNRRRSTSCGCANIGSTVLLVLGAVCCLVQNRLQEPLPSSGRFRFKYCNNLS